MYVLGLNCCTVFRLVMRTVRNSCPARHGPVHLVAFHEEEARPFPDVKGNLARRDGEADVFEVAVGPINALGDAEDARVGVGFDGKGVRKCRPAWPASPTAEDRLEALGNGLSRARGAVAMPGTTSCSVAYIPAYGSAKSATSDSGSRLKYCVK